MTDLTAHDRDSKRHRLIASAGDLLHRQGVVATTIAQVAQAAAVPPGNVYYYFKTKDDLVRAVIDARVDDALGMLASCETPSTPAARLKALAGRWVEMGELLARYGCPFGTLAAELDRRDDGLDLEAARPIRAILDWVEEQLHQMNRPDAGDLAVVFFAGIQGGALLANTFRAPEMMSVELRHLEQWIDSLS